MHPACCPRDEHQANTHHACWTRVRNRGVFLHCWCDGGHCKYSGLPHNGEVIRNTYEGVSFACENTFSFVVPGTITFAKLQYGLCQSIESDILKRVSNILYRSPIVVFGSLIQFEVMPIVDETSIQQMFHIHQQTQVKRPRVKLIEAYEGINNDSDEKFEATYEVGDKDEDGDWGGEAVRKL
ncbi:hypothetical protein Ahy_B04g071685 [Arachis hypogaea]|uniref:Uncharacterized protein n=1 Tax=Arachis hypogaea TaxID=3818 RepID=A0A444ZLD0_ARAHY|nr:hypothetical protein Ahy_B04g071685 [Arachis hypogaea]